MFNGLSLLLSFADELIEDIRSLASYAAWQLGEPLNTFAHFLILDRRFQCDIDSEISTFPVYPPSVLFLSCPFSRPLFLLQESCKISCGISPLHIKQREPTVWNLQKPCPWTVLRTLPFLRLMHVLQRWPLPRRVEPIRRLRTRKVRRTATESTSSILETAYTRPHSQLVSPLHLRVETLIVIVEYSQGS